MGVTAPTGPIDAARTALHRERRQVLDETSALEEFSDRISELSVNRPTSPREFPLTERQTATLRAVRTAYEETVMAVPHYDREYGEPLAVHMAGEVGAEIAAAVTRGTQLHPPLKRTLLETTSEAINARVQLLALMDEEEEQLDGTERTVVDIIRRIDDVLDQPIDRMEFNALRLTRERLLELRTECDELVEDRQAFLERQRRLLPDPMTGLAEYLYQGCESTFPLLTVFARLAAVLDRAIERAEGRLSTAR